MLASASMRVDKWAWPLAAAGVAMVLSVMRISLLGMGDDRL
jgi:hypothetical protein